MPKRGENIYKRKDGRWEGRFIKDRTHTGKAVYGYVYAHSYKEIRLKLQNALKMQDSMKKNKTGAEKEPRFSALAEEWFCHIRPLIKESTYIKYRNLWNSYVSPKLGKMCLLDLSHARLESYCKDLLVSGGNKGNGLSAKTVSDTLSLIRNMLRFCDSRDIPILCDARNVTVKQDAKEMRIFSPKEQQILCSHIRSNLCIQNVGILLCLFTGIRVGELCALKWEDISFAEQTLYVHQTMQRIQIEDTDREESTAKTKIIVTSPKSKCSIRRIPFPEELSFFMRSIQKSSSGYFLTGSETRWIKPRTMQNHFKRLLKCCEIEDANYHVLRHTFATRCMEMGFDVKSLSEILGHASVSITMNRYVHPSMELKRENMQRLSGFLTVES